MTTTYILFNNEMNYYYDETFTSLDEAKTFIDNETYYSNDLKPMSDCMNPCLAYSDDYRFLSLYKGSNVKGIITLNNQKRG